MVLIRPCATAAAFEAVPEWDLDLDVAAVRGRLEASGWRVVADAGAMVVVERDRVGATLFRSGKLLVKTVDAAVAERAWRDVSAHYLEAGSGGA